MDSFELKEALLNAGFKEYWHPGRYKKSKVKALGFIHRKYGVIYLKRNPNKPNNSQKAYPLVISGVYVLNIKKLTDIHPNISLNPSSPTYHNSNLRGFPQQINPNYKGNRISPQHITFGIHLDIKNQEGLQKLLEWMESINVDSKKVQTRGSDNLKVHDEKVLQEIKTRRGQTKFRQKLLESYGYECCITQSKVESVLEAAHIIPHSGVTDYSQDNGLLLRADIHTLFDLNLIGVDEFGVIHIHETLKKSEYKEFENKLVAFNLTTGKVINLKSRFNDFKNKQADVSSNNQ